MIQTVYLSTAARDLGHEDLERILTVSRRNNAAVGVTGMLLYHDRSIIQVLEGPDEAVEATLARIQQDTRHHGLMRLIDAPITERQFPDWSMGCSSLQHLDHALEGRSAYLDPGALDDLPAYLGAEPARAHRLLESFKAGRR